MSGVGCCSYSVDVASFSSWLASGWWLSLAVCMPTADLPIQRSGSGYWKVLRDRTLLCSPSVLANQEHTLTCAGWGRS